MERSPEASTQTRSPSTSPIHHEPTHTPNTEKEIEEGEEAKHEEAATTINGGDISRNPPRETDDEEFDDLDLRNEPEHEHQHQPKGTQEINGYKDPDLKDEPRQQQEQQQQPQHQPEPVEEESSGFDESGAKTTSNSTNASTQIDDQSCVLRPHSHLPQPLAPPGLLHQPPSPPPPPPPPSKLPPLPDQQQTSAITSFLRRRLSSLKDPEPAATTITEFRITNVKVIVELKDQEAKSQSPAQVGGFMGRITFFSRSNCRDCGAVRSFLRERRLPYVEINVDVFPSREEELRRRTGDVSVPQIFFNENLVGGLVALNTLRNSGEFESKLAEMAGERCGEGAPAVPVYGFDEDVVVEEDGLVEVVRVVRKNVKVRDFVRRVKLLRSCFEGRELVEVVIQHLDCARKKAVEVGRELLRKHLIHHVFREMDFEDGNNLYRLLEHDPMVPKCYNFRVTTNDHEPKRAYVVGQRITKLMFAILEAYASEDRRHLDYRRISQSEEFRRYVNAVHDLQRVDLFALSTEERLAFFLNVYNAMAIHAVIRIGCPEGIMERRAFFNDFHYMVGGYPYSLSTIRNGILRSNSRQPYAIARPFAAGDKRLELALPQLNPLIHFGLCNATRSSPAVQFFSSQGVEVELRQAAREFFQSGGVEVDLEKRTVYLTKIIRWFSVDFPRDKELLRWILNFIDATKAGFLIHLLRDGGPVQMVYQNYDWSLNV